MLVVIQSSTEPKSFNTASNEPCSREGGATVPPQPNPGFQPDHFNIQKLVWDIETHAINGWYL